MTQSNADPLYKHDYGVSNVYFQVRGNGVDSWVDKKKIEYQESLNVFIQSLFSDAYRLNVSEMSSFEMFSLKCSLSYFLDETIKTIVDVSNSHTTGYNITSV